MAQVKIASWSDIIPAKEAAEVLRVSIQTLYNWKAQGRLSGINLGGRKGAKLFFYKAEIERLLQGKEAV